MKTRIVYLLHFEQKLSHAQHYLGSTDNLIRRMKEHKDNTSQVRIVQEFHSQGIGFALARVWKGDKTFERDLKNRKSSPKLCPICQGKKLYKKLTLD